MRILLLVLLLAGCGSTEIEIPPYMSEEGLTMPRIVDQARFDQIVLLYRDAEDCIGITAPGPQIMLGTELGPHLLTVTTEMLKEPSLNSLRGEFVFWLTTFYGPPTKVCAP